MSSFESWGRQPEVRQHEIFWSREEAGFPRLMGSSGLPVGLGRSYGDVCLNDGGTVVRMTPLDRLLDLDEQTGVLHCEAGVSFASIIEYALPRGWFLPVTPGTKYVTVGGAIANDVHGKNHHRSGTFGRYVRRFELLRSDGRRYQCSETENPELYSATIGGLGLTGIVTRAEITLRRVSSPLIDLQSTRFASLAEFFSLSAESHGRFEYTVAWLDCLARGRNFGRGIFLAGNHADGPDTVAAKSPLRAGKGFTLDVPFDFPRGLINRYSAGLFNALYYYRQLPRRVEKQVGCQPFFYPLDALTNWNRLYGPDGFFQFQCVLPAGCTEELLQTIVEAESASFLAVLKEFGEAVSPGLLSFPRPGVTLALDFPNRGAGTAALLRRLDAFVAERGGAIYPAKDNFMAPESFRKYYPNWERFARWIDPAFSSSFIRRVGG